MERPMRRFLGLAALAGVGVLAYRAMKKRRSDEAGQQPQPQPPSQPVRDAGPGAMRDEPRTWGRTDQRVDESFPASDPPGTY
jgi:uncharacterized membrane protein YebE (DUF533 family)